MLTPLIEREALPVLEIVSVAVVERQTQTSPKNKMPVETEMLGAATGVTTTGATGVTTTGATGVTTTGAAGATPVPEIEMVELGWPGSLLEMVRVPDFEPSLLGVNVTATSWLPPAPTVKDDGDKVN